MLNHLQANIATEEICFVNVQHKLIWPYSYLFSKFECSPGHNISGGHLLNIYLMLGISDAVGYTNIILSNI